EDIRSVRPYLFSRSTLVALGRRLASVAALVTIDLVGLVLGVFVALIFRVLYLGEWPPLWGILWDTETNWLPFLTVITVLVFWVGGLYRRRELRAGLGQIVFSLVLVAVITLAFGLGTGYHFNTYGLTPTALVLTALFVGMLCSSSWRRRTASASASRSRRGRPSCSCSARSTSPARVRRCSSCARRRSPAGSGPSSAASTWSCRHS